MRHDSSRPSRGFPNLSLITLLAALMPAVAAQGAPDMVVVGYGGDGQKAQSEAFFKPFEAEDGKPIIQSEYNGEMARIRVMADTGHVDWDLVQIEGPDLVRGCESGMFERLDWQRMGGSERLIEDAAQECGSAALVWGVALAYDADRLKAAPTSWADFWDLEKFPGKRGLRKRAVYNLEFALLADGVPVADVYKVLASPGGVDRAFAKLDQIKPQIQWWEAGAQPTQWLAAGDVVMTSSYSGRVAAAHQAGRNLDLVLPGSLYGMDYWAIIKGSRHAQQAERLIAFANRKAPQLEYIRRIPYGPTNRDAAAALDAEQARWIPVTPDALAASLPMDVEFWVDHGEELEERFNAWAVR